MAIKLMQRKWSEAMDDSICEFVCDTDADFESLPPSATGSVAVSAESGALMMVNASDEWTEFAK